MTRSEKRHYFSGKLSFHQKYLCPRHKISFNFERSGQKKNRFFLLFVEYFHDMIWHDELARCGAGGVLAGVFLPNGWGLSPILAHGSEYIKNKVARDCITGKKSIALCVTEPSGTITSILFYLFS